MLRGRTPESARRAEGGGGGTDAGGGASRRGETGDRERAVIGPRPRRGRVIQIKLVQIQVLSRLPLRLSRRARRGGRDRPAGLFNLAQPPRLFVLCREEQRELDRLRLGHLVQRRGESVFHINPSLVAQTLDPRGGDGREGRDRFLNLSAKRVLRCAQISKRAGG